MVVAKNNFPQIKVPTQPLPKPPVAEQPPVVKTPDVKEPSIKIGGDIGIAHKPHPGTGQIQLPGCFPPIKPPTHPQLVDFDKIIDDHAVDAKDGNHDGRLNRDEFDKNEGLLEQVNGDKFKAYDKDDDGYVTKDEYHSAKEAERFEKQMEDQIGNMPHVLGGVAEKAGDVVSDLAKKIF